MKIKLKIKRLEWLIDRGIDFFVSTPDGPQRATKFVDKGMFEEHILTSNNIEVRCNENHIFQTLDGWKFAKDMIGQKNRVLHQDGKYHDCNVTNTNNMIPIVDIAIDHPNHRYYTNGISSHNTGVGKSTAMCHMAAGFVMSGKNVLYITMEMAEERISERIDANLLNVDIGDLVALPKDAFEKQIEDLHKKTAGKFFVKEFPTAGAHAGHFRHLLRELKLKKNFKADIVFIDYLNICSSSRVNSSDNTYVLVKSIAEELRGLAIEQNIAIVTATQSNRGALGGSDIDITDTSESIGTPQTLDLYIGMITTDQLNSMSQVMFKCLKTRFVDQPALKPIVMGIDRPKMKLYELENNVIPAIASSNTKEKFNEVSDPFAGFEI